VLIAQVIFFQTADTRTDKVTDATNHPAHASADPLVAWVESGNCKQTCLRGSASCPLAISAVEPIAEIAALRFTFDSLEKVLACSANLLEGLYFACVNFLFF